MKTNEYLQHFHMSLENLWFPVDFLLSQPIDTMFFAKNRCEICVGNTRHRFAGHGRPTQVRNHSMPRSSVLFTEEQARATGLSKWPGRKSAGDLVYGDCDGFLGLHSTGICEKMGFDLFELFYHVLFFGSYMVLLYDLCSYT